MLCHQHGSSFVLRPLTRQKKPITLSQGLHNLYHRFGFEQCTANDWVQSLVYVQKLFRPTGRLEANRKAPRSSFRKAVAGLLNSPLVKPLTVESDVNPIMTRLTSKSLCLGRSCETGPSRICNHCYRLERRKKRKAKNTARFEQ